jgi:hypothetical protein
MKNRMISGAVTVALGLLVAFGPQFIFKVCTYMDDAYPRCHWSAQGEIGIGMIIAALGAALLLFADRNIRFGITLGIFFASIIALSIPHVLIGGCAMMSMDCRRVAFPVLSVISILLLLGSLANMFFLEWKDRP